MQFCPYLGGLVLAQPKHPQGLKLMPFIKAIVEFFKTLLEKLFVFVTRLNIHWIMFSFI